MDHAARHPDGSRPGPARWRGRRIEIAVLFAAVLGAALMLAAALWWLARPEPAPPRPQATAAPPPAAPREVPVAEPPAPELPIASDGVVAALRHLLGERATSSRFDLTDFPRRFVATVDNLGREHAPWLVWPVERTPGRLMVIERDGRMTLDPRNSARYAPLILALEGVDAAAAVSLYRRLLPLLQRSYEELGFGGRRFHARLLQVIDHLLATPEPSQPIALTLTEVRGPIPPRQSWLRYEFEDPALEAASAGQKIMLRVGLENERRLKAKLRELRSELLKQSKP